MNVKKHPKADLERKRFAFFQIGLILAGAICLAAFEYTSSVYSSISTNKLDQDTIFVMPDIPKVFIASAQPKIKQHHIQEVRLVLNLPPEIKPTLIKPDSIIEMIDLSKVLEKEPALGILPVNNMDTVNIPDIMPKFPGNLGEWISKNIILPNFGYPASGMIVVNFVVNKKGEITNVRIGKGLDLEHNNAALMVVKKMPKWTPGEQFGKPVAVNFDLPIRIINQ